jgi:signal transduction histidine kinase
MPSSVGRQRRWRLWTSRLWILSAALGLATIVSMVAIIHDTSQRRQAAALVAITTAQQVLQAAHERMGALHGPGEFPLAHLPIDSARALAKSIFDPIIATQPTLGRLDSASIRISRGNGEYLYGALRADRHIRASMRVGTPAEGLNLDVALSQDQIPHVLLMPVHSTALWHNGVLLLSTIIVLALAVVSAKRETALASARGDFIAGVSHDLRMPLAQILLAGETLTLRDDLQPPERDRLGHSIVRESKRLISLVENLLLFSRSGAVELAPRRDRIAVAALFADTAEAVHLAAVDAGQSLDVRAPADLELVGDARLVRQALVNLIDNALKYGPRGQAIGLAAERAGPMVRLVVDDAGPGIPLTERERVFDAYERLTRDQSSERTGTGLGLAVVAYIARASGGRVSLTDSPLGGTRAILELPAA